MINIRPSREQRLFGGVAVVLFLLVAAINNDHARVLERNKVPQWLRHSDPLGAGRDQLLDYTQLPHAENPSNSDLYTTITNTTAETMIPGGAHAPGFTVFDRLYLRAGTFYVVTADPSSWPPRRYLIAKPLKKETGQDLEPTDEVS